MPSYIQILFAPRKPIPFLEPIKKPFKYHFVPFHDGKTDYARLNKILEQKKEERMKNQQFLEESNTMKKIYLKKKGVSWKEKKKEMERYHG